MVRGFDVKTPDQVIAYMIDCTLATVEDLARKKSRGKHEYHRQQKIAEQGIQWARQMGVDLSTTRAQSVIDETNGNVSMWAVEFEV